MSTPGQPKAGESRPADEPRRVVVLGSTGTIGELVLDVARRHADRVRIVGLAAGRNVEQLARQAREFAPAALALADPSLLPALREGSPLPGNPELLAGDDGLCRLAAWPQADIVVNGIVGAAGLRPTLAALAAGRRVGLANKESMVLAGHLVCEAIARHGGAIVPIDSEHSALWQCLQGRTAAEVRRLWLTASGGPFRGRTAAELQQVTAREALQHPTWRMGRRITIDSATLFNKGLELIEAHWLFGVPFERIDVVIHPQSIVHGLVEFTDGSYLAQLSPADMRLPIQLALSLPGRWGAPAAPWSPSDTPSLTFEKPDEQRFPCLRIAREAGIAGGTAPAVANAADELLVAAFLEGRVPWRAIPRGIARVLREHRPIAVPALDDVLAADAWARRETMAWVDEGDFD
ncbi:MAG: 1-deoxy-D-xylulose-5-phosphate reductoisomerase [Candidatus Eisenbacteria bacterium]